MIRRTSQRPRPTARATSATCSSSGSAPLATYSEIRATSPRLRPSTCWRCRLRLATSTTTSGSAHRSRGRRCVGRQLFVRRYAEWLLADGRDSCRQQIPLPDGTSLYTDLFDLPADELVEAKADADRGSVRAGLGQVLDHGRFVDHSTKALLLPSRPTEDLLDLLHDYGVSAIWVAGDGFDRS
jgi:hypothetical protein